MSKPQMWACALLAWLTRVTALLCLLKIVPYFGLSILSIKLPRPAIIDLPLLSDSSQSRANSRFREPFPKSPNRTQICNQPLLYICFGAAPSPGSLSLLVP